MEFYGKDKLPSLIFDEDIMALGEDFSIMINYVNFKLIEK